MTHDELVKYGLSIHGVLLSAVFIAFYKYGDRSELVKTVTVDAKETVDNLRYRIAERLRECLRPVFEDVEVIYVTPLLNDLGNPWTESTVNPAGGEAYRNALGSFIDDNVDVIADYRTLKSAVSRWMTLSGIRSWSTWWASVWQLLAVAVLGLGEKLMGFTVPDALIHWSFVPIVIAVVLFLGASGVMNYLRDQLSFYFMKYQVI